VKETNIVGRLNLTRREAYDVLGTAEARGLISSDQDGKDRYWGISQEEVSAEKYLRLTKEVDKTGGLTRSQISDFFGRNIDKQGLSSLWQKACISGNYAVLKADPEGGRPAEKLVPKKVSK
jgi:hypothetical protein